MLRPIEKQPSSRVSSVKVRLVQHDGSKIRAEERRVLRSAKHVFQHGIIRHEDVRARAARAVGGEPLSLVIFTAARLLSGAHPAGVERGKVAVQRGFVIFGRLGREVEMAEGRHLVVKVSAL